MDAIYNRFKVLSMDSDDEIDETYCVHNTPPYPPFPTPTPTPPPVVLTDPPIAPVLESNNRFISIISEKDVESLTTIFTSQRPSRSLRNDTQYRKPRGTTYSKAGLNMFPFRNTVRTSTQVNTNSNVEFPSIVAQVISTSSSKLAENINFARTVCEMAERQKKPPQELSNRDNSIDALSAPISRFRRTLEDILADENASTGFTSMNDSFSDDNTYHQYDDSANMDEDL